MSESPKMSRRNEVETLLPFYLNGTLSGKDLHLVEDWLANDPAADAALIAAESELAFVSEENERIRPSSDAFFRFSESLEKEAGPQVSSVSRLSAWFGKTFAIPAPLVWATAAAAVVLMIVATSNLRQPDLGESEVAGVGETQNAAFVLVTFKPEAALGDIAKLLQASGGHIADGPDASGMFKIALPAASIADYDRITGELAKSLLVDQVIAGRKPHAD